VKERERRICDLPNKDLADYAVNGRPPDVKFTQTDFLVQNSSPPLMIVNFLFCDAYFHKKVLVNGQLFVAISRPKPLLLEEHLLLAIATNWQS